MAELIEKLVGCNECDHEDVCMFKKENSQKSIAYPEVENFSPDFLQFYVNIRCKHFKHKENSCKFGSMSEILEYNREKEKEASKAKKVKKPCSKCIYHTSRIPIDQSPCWGCYEENGYSSFEEYTKKG